jgi:hypothetical protein
VTGAYEMKKSQSAVDGENMSGVCTWLYDKISIRELIRELFGSDKVFKVFDSLFPSTMAPLTHPSVKGLKIIKSDTKIV